MTEINRMIKEEIGKASNIQKKSMKDSVVDLLTKIHSRLAFYGNKAPSNGLIMLAGNARDK